MSSYLRLLVAFFVFCLSLAACSESESPETNASATTATAVALQNAKIEVGMTEEAVKAILGDPKIIQTRTIDELTITHSEWTDKSGTTSVQFQNGKVMFNQFFPASEE
jgi:ABC-type uncharacterized transport system auxiliary subunit